MSSYKVGDTVRIAKSRNIHEHCYDPGDRVVVMEINEDTLEVEREGDHFTQTVAFEDVVGVASMVLPTDAASRKSIPLCSGVLDYFPNALAYVAKISKAGNDQHNPGEPLHWARGKSNDHADCIVRHLLERGSVDTDGQLHSGKLAWRALALLEEELEAAGAPRGRGSQ